MKRKLAVRFQEKHSCKIQILCTSTVQFYVPDLATSLPSLVDEYIQKSAPNCGRKLLPHALNPTALRIFFVYLCA